MYVFPRATLAYQVTSKHDCFHQSQMTFKSGRVFCSLAERVSRIIQNCRLSLFPDNLCDEFAWREFVVFWAVTFSFKISYSSNFSGLFPFPLFRCISGL